jgi:pimeloyl-ACP methyl ester carboxylesterase
MCIYTQSSSAMPPVVRLAVLAAIVLLGAAPAQARTAERQVRFGPGHLYVRDTPGREPAFVLMHGFPGNTHLYDRLVPHLRGRRVTAFDFVGWGRSSRPPGHRYTFAEQASELDAVVRALHLGPVVPVAHDASGPAAINWSLDHPDRVAALALLNTFYSAMPTTNAPEAIRLFSDPVFASLASALAQSPSINRWLFRWQVGRFISSRAVRSDLFLLPARHYVQVDRPASVARLLRTIPTG